MNPITKAYLAVAFLLPLAWIVHEKDPMLGVGFFTVLLVIASLYALIEVSSPTPPRKRIPESIPNSVAFTAKMLEEGLEKGMLPARISNWLNEIILIGYAARNGVSLREARARALSDPQFNSLLKKFLKGEYEIGSIEDLKTLLGEVEKIWK